MATLTQKIQCERDAREMIRRNGLPEPDRVEYGHTCIRLFWEETKVVLVVDIDEPPEGVEFFGSELAGLEDEDLEDFEDEGLEDFDDDDVLAQLRRLNGREEEEAA